MNTVALPKWRRRHDAVGTTMSALIKISSPFSLFLHRCRATPHGHVAQRSYHLDLSQPLYPLNSERELLCNGDTVVVLNPKGR